MIYKSELSVDCTAGNELSGFDVDVFGGMVGNMSEEAAHRHQAVQAGGFLVSGFTLWVQLASRPTPHVSGAVECTVSVCVCGQKKHFFNILEQNIY